MPKGYSAKWIISGDGNLYENSTLIVDEGKVEGIFKTEELTPESCKHVRDYGNSIITPGFINLHNHLQYTEVGHKTSSFWGFLKRIVATLRKNYFLAGIKKTSFVYKIGNLLSEYFQLTRDEKLKSFKNGLIQSVLNGTTTVAQLSRETKYFEILNEVPIKTYLFFELFSDGRESSKIEFRSIQKRIDKLLKNKSENTFIGVAPHSICSVHKRLFKTLVKYCKKNNILMTVRIAESSDELDWLKFGFSDVDIMNAFCGLKKFEPYVKGVSPVTYLNELGVINKRLIASYCNFLSDADLEILKENEVSLAYCPRVSEGLHQKRLGLDSVLKYFPNNFGFGTNSLTFNGDLSLLNEVKAVNDGVLSPLDVIKYLTSIPAKILRIDNITGSLHQGKDADFNVFKLNEGEGYEGILNKSKPEFVYIKGKKIVKNGELKIRIEKEK